MAPEQTIANLIDEAIEALATLDLEALHRIEQRATAFAVTPTALNRTLLPALLEKQRLFGRILEDTATNLSLLRRLHSRKDDLPWAR